MNEKISALMDGELDAREMQDSIREMRTDREAQKCWDQYHLIGEAMRKDLPNQIDSAFFQRVSEAVAQENIPVSQPLPQSTEKHGVSRQVVGFAMAASVAMVAYLGFGVISVDEQIGPQVAAVAPTTSLPLTKQVTVQDGLRTVQAQHWTEAQPSVESRLDNYLINHRNMVSTAAMNNHMVTPSQSMIVSPGRGE